MADKKEDTIIIRVSREEKERIQAAAESHHLKLSQFIRMLVLHVIDGYGNGSMENAHNDDKLA